MPWKRVGGLVAVLLLGGLAPPMSDRRMSPYAGEADHLWNRIHRALFVRTGADGTARTHITDPLLYRGGTFLLEGDSHRQAVKVLDEFVATAGAEGDDPRKRLLLQRDLWAVFDYLAWYPDDWVHHSKHEGAAIALRTRLATAIGRLALDRARSKRCRTTMRWRCGRGNLRQRMIQRVPDKPFLPADLFDPAGPWVRFHHSSAQPMAREHFEAAGGRAAHVIFIRLPQGRAATEQYLRQLPERVEQFPPGTMVAMVRRALAVDRGAKLRVTPVTELVQIRVYLCIPEDRHANMHGDFGEQDVYEFVLDREEFLAGKHGLRAVGADEPADPFVRNEGDPFSPGPQREQAVAPKQLQTCIQCHQSPGVYSVLSMQQVLRGDKMRDERFRTYGLDIELKYTSHAKSGRFDWGLLQGMLQGMEAGGGDEGRGGAGAQ